jgi:hypothetical protein
LEDGDHPLQKLWNRKDALATNQLVWFGDAVLRMRAVGSRWADAELKKVKADSSEQGINRKGAAFEILGLGIFTERLRVVPRSSGNPGYDGTLHFPDGGRLDLSLKNYGASTHERGVQDQGRELEEKFCKVLQALSLNGLHLRVIAKRYPSDADWSRLRDNLHVIVETDPKVLGHAAQDAVWAVMLRPLGEFDARTAPRLSYQVTVLIPLHANERQNLISKLDVAYANAQKHGTQDEGLARGVLFHLPENASMANCVTWAKEYFVDRPEGLVDLVIFYQPSVVATEQGGSAIGHAFDCVPGPRFLGWSRGGGGKPRLPVGDFYAGVILDKPGKLELRSDDGNPQDPCWLRWPAASWTTST